MNSQETSPMSPLRFDAALHELLPASDPDALWIFRLVVLRQDLVFEWKSYRPVDPESSASVWRAMYFLRRLSSTVRELLNIFKHDLQKSESASYDRGAKDCLEAVFTMMAPLRHSVGVHVRPEPEAFAAVVAAHGATWRCRVSVCPEDPSGTDLTELAAAALLFGMPEANRSFEEQFIRLGQLLADALPPVLATIDLGLHDFWSENRGGAE